MVLSIFLLMLIPQFKEQLRVQCILRPLTTMTPPFAKLKHQRELPIHMS